MEMKTTLPAGTPVYGVDVGNGYGKISILLNWNSDPIRMLPPSLPAGMSSTVYTESDGTIYVYGAKQRRASQSISAVKSLLGDEYILQHEYRGKTYRINPCDAYAAIARDLVQLANEQRRLEGQEPVYRMILTYPAGFRHQPALLHKLKSSVESIVLDGQHLQVCGMLSEPAAVAVDYLYYVRHLADKPIDAAKYTILAYDLGHGTFDTAVVTAYADSGKDCDLIAQGTEPDVGGKKFDDLLVEEFTHQIHAQVGAKVSFDRERLRVLAVDIKHALSNPECRMEERDFSTDETEVLLRITREDFEKLIEPQLIRTMETVQNVLEEASQKNAKIDAVVLSGGGGNIPMAQQLLQELTGGSVPVRAYRPNFGVSFGAARVAYDLYPKNNGKQSASVITQHCERSSGLRINDKVIFLLNEEDALPCTSKPFAFQTPATGLVEIHLRRARKLMPGAKEAAYEECVDIQRLTMEVPPLANCTLTLRMDTNRCTFVDCKLPNGSVITKSTFCNKEAK